MRLIMSSSLVLPEFSSSWVFFSTSISAWATESTSLRRPLTLSSTAVSREARMCSWVMVPVLGGSPTVAGCVTGEAVLAGG
uniref:Putative secreted protein n=1 Tax=Ixodes ricinus TaxID=34613 RepID=A0A6B0U6R9_IXORI